MLVILIKLYSPEKRAFITTFFFSIEKDFLFPEDNEPVSIFFLKFVEIVSVFFLFFSITLLVSNLSS